MEIKLSTPDLFIDSKIDRIAASAGCIARLKWHNPNGARFILVDHPMSNTPATFEQHDSVIRALLELDPRARVRTSLGVFDGLNDWDAQYKARVPA